MGFNQKTFLESVKFRTYVVPLFLSIVLCGNKTFKMENNSRRGILVISPLLPVFVLFLCQPPCKTDSGYGNLQKGSHAELHVSIFCQCKQCKKDPTGTQLTGLEPGSRACQLYCIRLAFFSAIQFRNFWGHMVSFTSVYWKSCMKQFGCFILYFWLF